MAFEHNIVILRRKKSWTQADLAEKMSVKKQAVSQWENGRSFLGKEDLYRLADVLGVHVSVLFFDTIDDNITSVSADSTRLKELSLRFHEERDKVANLEFKVLRLEADLVKVRASEEDYKKEVMELRKKVIDLSMPKTKTKR
jgi:transcriptional regulator with XRE-family HTH domain